MADLRRCEQCKKPFVDDEGWKKKCIICWKEAAKYALTKSDHAYRSLQDEFQRMEASIERTRVDVQGMEDERRAHEAACQRYEERIVKIKAAYHKLKQMKDTSPLTDERIMQLVKLVHPDRHQNSEMSTEITRWLLGLRAKN